ncbi:Kinesin domain containing protein [Asbolus verrucosus]|uniref:Kinesin domain containing protein n=1 Tax=Asbolus verrucosus TaxID=1661398 RepID=A0A482VMP8_ASBVE|nr:Kinesin domain containing protein [Asbolus verrucosus]
MKSKMVETKFTKVYFRIFPMERMVWDYVKILDDHKTIYIRCLQELAKSKENVIPTFWTFQTDQVFYNNSQKEVYDSVITDVLDNISQGQDVIITAYGQTGTGKSLTISGLHHSYEDRGILPRLIPDLFRMKKTATATRNDIKMCIQVSFVEISRSTIVDLLKPYPNLENSLKNISKIKVRNEDEVYKLIFRGEGRKEYSENSPYPSHLCSSICTFYITTRNVAMQNNQLSQCKLHIVDLAGTDTMGNFSCFFKNPHEIGRGNLAKTQLEQFFLVLSADIPEQIKVKYRLNPIIQYLGTSLSNSSVLRFIGHIRVEREDLLLTISMLRFGELIGGLKASKYEIKTDNNEVSLEKMHQLQEELKTFKIENKYNSILMHQDLARSLNEERFAHVQRTVNEYLQNKITELTLLNVCEANIALEILKLMCKKCEGEKVKDAFPAKLKKLPSSSNKIHPKSSRGSTKTSSTSTVTNKINEEKEKERMNMAKSRSALSSVKISRDTVPSLRDSSSKTRSKTSSTSLLRRSLTERRKSQSSASNRESRPKSKSDSVLMPDEIPPEYGEAWGLYMKEKIEEYRNFVELYERNELDAKTSYKLYLTELDNLRQIKTQIDKFKKIFLHQAKMTREFQNMDLRDEHGELIPSEFERCCLEEMRKAEREHADKQEVVLRSQSELKMYINICKQVKRELKENFDQYCREKYQMPLIESLVDDVTMLNIEDIFEEAEEEELKETKADNVKTVENKEMKEFERFKFLTANEKRKRKLYQMKHKEWIWY